jgi:hypothetical protein
MSWTFAPALAVVWIYNRLASQLVSFRRAGTEMDASAPKAHQQFLFQADCKYAYLRMAYNTAGALCCVAS